MKEKIRKQPDSLVYLIIQDDLISFLDEMLLELYENRLEVTSATHPDPDKHDRLVRVLTSTNPQWYQEMCSLYPDYRPSGYNKKKPRTRIKRRNVLMLLECLIRNKKSRSIYAEFLINIAKDRLKSMQPVLEPWAGQF